MRRASRVVCRAVPAILVALGLALGGAGPAAGQAAPPGARAPAPQASGPDAAPIRFEDERVAPEALKVGVNVESEELRQGLLDAANATFEVTDAQSDGQWMKLPGVTYLGSSTLVVSQCHVLTALHVVQPEQKNYSSAEGSIVALKHAASGARVSGRVLVHGESQRGIATDWAVIRLDRRANGVNPVKIAGLNFQGLKQQPKGMVSLPADWELNGQSQIAVSGKCDLNADEIELRKAKNLFVEGSAPSLCHGFSGSSGGSLIAAVSNPKTQRVEARLVGIVNSVPNGRAISRPNGTQAFYGKVWFTDLSANGREILQAIRDDLAQRPCE